MDPRIFPPDQRGKPTIRDLMIKARSKNEKLNLCPCGCKDADLDENNYCDHLIGWTNDGIYADIREQEPKVAMVVDEETGEVKKWWPRGVVPERTGAKVEKIVFGEGDNQITLRDMGTVSKRVYKGKRVLTEAENSNEMVLQKQIERLEKLLEAQSKQIMELQETATKPVEAVAQE